MATSERPQPTSRSSPADRRREVVRGAANLFDQAGYHNTTVEDIARAVGLRKATLYHYFNSKDEILLWIHEEFIDLLISRHEARRAVAMPAKQRLLEIMADILELMETHRGHVRVFFEHHRELPAAQQESIKLKRDAYEAYVEGEIARGIEDGELRPVDIRLATFALFGICNWAYQWYRPQGLLRTRDLAYVFWDILMNGIASQPSASA